MFVNHIFKRYKLNVVDNQIYDPIRKKYVALTSEEKVRQQMLKYMLQRLNGPADKIGVERTLETLGDIGNKKRVDICIWGESGEILAVVECKANYIGCDEAPYRQAFDYIESLKVRNYFVVDGWELNGYHYDYSRGQFDVLEEMPVYQDMLELL